jgi:hypothetical protein
MVVKLKKRKKRKERRSSMKKVKLVAQRRIEGHRCCRYLDPMPILQKGLILIRIRISRLM